MTTTTISVSTAVSPSLDLVEHHVWRWSVRTGIRVCGARDEKRRGYLASENLAWTHGLILRTLALAGVRDNTCAAV